jgi:hypothetical protein
MFVSELTKSLAKSERASIEGGKDAEKMQMLRDEKSRREQSFQLNKTAQEQQIEYMGQKLQQLELINMQQAQTMLKDGSYDNIDQFLKSGAKNIEFLRENYVRNPLLNKTMSQKLGLGQITGVEYNPETNEIKFEDSTSGKEIAQPLDVMLSSIGYFTKRNKLKREESKSNLELLKTQLGIKKAEAETEKEQLDIDKKKLDLYPKYAEQTAKVYSNQDLINNSELTDEAFEAVNKYADEKQKTEYSKSMGKQLLDLTERADSLVKDTKQYKLDSAVQTKVDVLLDRFTVWSQDKNRTKEEIEKEQANLITTLTKISGDNKALMLLADYIKLKTGAAFSQEELNMAKQLIGIGVGDSYEVQVQSRKDFRDNLLDQSLKSGYTGLGTVGEVLYAKDYHNYKKSKIQFGGKTYDLGDIVEGADGNKYEVTGFNEETGKLKTRRVK